MTTPGTPSTLPVGRHALASYSQYEQAQAVVDHLSDSGFPVETVTIVGADLRLVEQVTGRLTTGKAALAGAASTGWLGLLFGALFGAVLGFVAHRATGGRRDFSSTKGLAATRYEILVDPARAEEAERLLAQYKSGG
jgi:hypothetical protein